MDKVYERNVSIERLQVVDMNAKKGQVLVKVNGILPNPSYEIERMDIQIKGDEILLVPKVKHDPKKIVIQMMVPFEEEVTVKGLKQEQSYKIKIKGPEKSFEQSFTLPK